MEDDTAARNGHARRSRSRSNDAPMRSSKWDSSANSSRPGVSGSSRLGSGVGDRATVSSIPTVYTNILSVTPGAVEAAQAAAEIANKLSQSLNQMFQPPPPPGAAPSVPISHNPGYNDMSGEYKHGAFPWNTTDGDCDKKNRKIYVGNLPGGCTQPDVVGFFNGALLAVNAQTGFITDHLNASCEAHSQVLPVESCENLNEQQRFCFLELKSHQWVVLCMKLDGISFNNYSLKVGRPLDYVTPPGGDPALACHIPALDDCRKPEVVQASAPPRHDVDCKLYAQNLPQEMGEDQVRDLFEQFGKLRILNLIKNVQTGQHKGYGFFEYEDPSVTDQAIEELNGFVCGAQVLSVQLANFIPQATPPEKPKQMSAASLPSSMTVAILSDPLVGIQVRAARKIGERPSKVLQLFNTVYQEDLIDNEEYEAILSDITAEAEKYGKVEQVVIPRPNADLSYKEGVGKVFLVYEDVTSARKAQLMINGRKFDNNRVVCAAFFPEARFSDGFYTLG